MVKQSAAILDCIAKFTGQAFYCLTPPFFRILAPCSSAISMSVLSARTLSRLNFKSFSSFSICLRWASIRADIAITSIGSSFFAIFSSVWMITGCKDAHFSWISKGLRQECIQEDSIWTLGRLYFNAISFLDLPLCMYSMQILRFNARLNFCLLIT